MKVLLIEPKTTCEEETILETNYEYPHLGLLSIAANLEKQGDVVDYFSPNIYKDPFSILKKRLDLGYDFVGISIISATIDYQLKIAEFVKDNLKDTKVVLGGIHAWLFPKEILENDSVDFVIRGLGEIPFSKLTKNNKLEDIPGLCYKTGSESIIQEPFLPSVEEFRTIESLIKYSKYDKVYKEAVTFRNTRHLFTSFGCPFACNFCSVPKLYKGKMFFKDINSTTDEVKELSKKTTRIMFVDPDLNVNHAHFVNLFSAILNEKKKGTINKNMTFIIQARLDCFNEEMLEIAKKANIIALIGIESLSQRIRDFDLNKGGKLAKMNKEEVASKIEEIRKYIKPYIYFILATPETTKKDLIDNLKYINSLIQGWYEINIHITPFPETNYYDQYKDTNLMVWRNTIINSNAVKIPIELKCKDREIENYISRASERATEKHRKNRRLSFANLFLKEIMEEVGL